jgi:hypothetical protein
VQLFVAQATRREVSGREVLEHDVRREREAPREGPPLVGLQVEDDGALRGVVHPELEAGVDALFIAEVGRRVPLPAAPGGLDLDDVGAEVGEQLAAVRTDLVAEFDDANTIEGEVGHAPSPGTAVTVFGRRLARMSAASVTIS